MCILPIMSKTLPYDPFKDFRPVHGFGIDMAHPCSQLTTRPHGRAQILAQGRCSPQRKRSRLSAQPSVKRPRPGSPEVTLCSGLEAGRVLTIDRAGPDGSSRRGP